MNLKKLRFISEKLSVILMQPFEFNGLKVTLNDVIRAKHAKNWIILPHHHPWFEFNYVAKGSLYTTINGEEFFITSGESYIIPPGVTHSHRNNKTGDDGICIRFGIDARSNNPILNALMVPRAKPFISNIDKMNLQGGVYSIKAEFMLWLMRLYENSINDTLPPIAVQNTFAAQVTLYLKEYFYTKIKAEDIANALNTSYRTLARKFNNETGTTISEALLKIRLEHAKQLLTSSNLPIYTVAAESGFEDEFYFSKRFKQKEKMSPSDYRKANQIRNVR